MSTFSNPVCQRSLCLLRKYIEEGEVAYYLGSGVDINLVQKVPSWNELVTNLYKIPFKNLSRENLEKSEEKDLEKLGEKFPNEFASFTRWSLGDFSFFKEVENKFSEKINDAPDSKDFIDNFCKLLLKASL